MTEREIIEAMRNAWIRPGAYLNGDQVAFFDLLRVGTGFTRNPSESQQVLDVFLMHLWGSQLRYVYEIKTSRNDFLRELKNPLKRRAGLMVSNYFYFICPDGVIKPDEIPVECGLEYILDSEGHTKTVVPAPYRDTEPPPWRFFASVARRAAQGKLSVTEEVDGNATGIPASNH